MKSCDKCQNYIWGDDVTPIPDVCLKCVYIDGVNGKEPSNWKSKPMTNADQIRSMTDEELATALYQMLDGDVYCTNKPECGKMLNTDDGIPDEWCAQCLLNWLRKPVEEGTNE